MTPDQIRDVSEAVYKMRLGTSDTAKMIEKDKDSGEKLRARAASYDPITRCYVEVLAGQEPVTKGER